MFHLNVAVPKLRKHSMTDGGDFFVMFSFESCNRYGFQLCVDVQYL